MPMMRRASVDFAAAVRPRDDDELIVRYGQADVLDYLFDLSSPGTSKQIFFSSSIFF